MKRLITISPIEDGYIWVSEGTHGTKYAFAKTITEAVDKSNKVLSGTEAATPPVILESPELNLYKMGNGFAIMKNPAGRLGMEIVAVLPLSVSVTEIAAALESVMQAERLEIEHDRVHKKESAEKPEGNVVKGNFPQTVVIGEDADPDPVN